MRSLASGGLSWPSLVLVVTQVDPLIQRLAQAPKYALEQALLCRSKTCDVGAETRQPRLEIGSLWRWSRFYLLDEKSGPPATTQMLLDGMAARRTEPETDRVRPDPLSFGDTTECRAGTIGA